MGIFDIFTLRPTEQTAAGISDALARAVAADAQQAAMLQQALEQRDALLLDGTPSALKAAEATLAAAREPAERVATIKRQLEQRLKEATERETMAAAEAARVEVEEALRVRAEWWLARRERLASEFAEGIKLSDDVGSATWRWQNATRIAAERYPGVTFAHPAVHPNDPGNWQYDVGSALNSDDPAGIARIGNPQQPGAF